MWLVTDKGVAMLDLVPGGLSLWLEDGFNVPDIVGASSISGYIGGPLRTELSYFASRILRNEKPQVVTSRHEGSPIKSQTAIRTTTASMPRSSAGSYMAFLWSLQENTTVTEHLRIEFRAEFFNAFNHANFDFPNTSFGTPYTPVPKEPVND